MPKFRAGAGILALFTALLPGCVSILCSPTSLLGQDVEEILSYDVTIDVRAGGLMEVTELITVRALGNQIRRGIYRDIPTSFPRFARLGRIEAPFRVMAVTLDDGPVRYRVEAIGGEIGRGGVRVRIGDANVLVESGVHRYAIRYETERWISFGSTEDQLYWNVTGNDWGFPIRSASARVRIAGLTTEPRLESFTGPEGSAETSAPGRWSPIDQIADFQTTQSLGVGGGLTVRLTFPAGELPPPTEAQKDTWFRLDWGGYIDGAYVVLFVIALYLLMWRRVGIDPARGRTPLRREPPDGYSPAALGFIENRGYSKDQLSAALVSMALKGALRIEQDGGSWTLHKVEAVPDLSPEEKKLFDHLLAHRNRIDLKQSNHATLGPAIKAFKQSLQRRLEKEYFVNNRRWFVAGVFISVLGLGIMVVKWPYSIDPAAAFLSLWLSIWTVGVVTLLFRAGQQVRNAAATRSVVDIGGAVFLLLFSTPFFIGEVVVGGILVVMLPSHLVFTAFGLGVINVVFYHLLERPTLAGRGVLDQLQGFRNYIEGTNSETLPQPEAEVAHFERFLPFAIALGLEARWATAFEGVLEPALLQGGDAQRPLHWYDSDRTTLGGNGFVTSLGSGLGSTFSSASSAPSSSGSGGGGGGGGGSSGGGGGGGGGGGW